MEREILHYRIESSLGKGGMGEVFKATDVRLGRTVALKFLPDALAGDAERRARFMLEAQAASRLTSPHIATLYDVGEHEGAIFLVMEYVEGDPLSTRMAHGSISVPEAVDIARQMALALADAHERGVVHRDVKPSNVMLTPPSYVKMLDFGLAKLIAPPSNEPPTVVIPPLTLPGSILGTFDYMSPEQALGDELDHRTDIFSLGVVLYEMLCGVRPFRGDTHMRVMDQIVHTPTPPLAGRAAHAPESVARAVRRALEKDLARRYQSAREMAEELAAWNAPVVATEAAPAAETPSGSPSGSSGPIVPDAVAVMTFANVTRRPEDDWLGTGIAETVTSDLKRVKGLTVIDRESVCCADAALAGVSAHASAETLARAAGRVLGAAWIVSGGFQRSGESLRITARFADARTGALLRTIKIDGAMSSIFDLQDRIVEELCDGLDLALARSEIAAIERQETDSVDAYRAYSRGLAELRDGEPEAFERAMVHLAEAVRLDPNYSVAWAALGSAYCLKGFFLAQREIIREALDFERKALAIDPTNALAHEWLSSAHLYLGDVEEAVRASREAMRLDPRLASARAAHGRAYWLGRGMIDEGIRELEAATGLDPNLGYAYLQLGYLYAITGDFERAEAASRRAVDLEDGHASGTLGLKMVGARTRLGYVYYRTGRFGEALAAYTIERATIEAGSHTVRDRALIELDQKIGAAHLALGHADEAAVSLGRAIAESRARAEWRPLDPATSYYFACALALTGEIQPALEALARAAAHHPAVTRLRALSDPDLAALAGEPEFRRLTAPDDDALATNVG